MLRKVIYFQIHHTSRVYLSVAMTAFLNVMGEPYLGDVSRGLRVFSNNLSSANKKFHFCGCKNSCGFRSQDIWWHIDLWLCHELKRIAKINEKLTVTHSIINEILSQTNFECDFDFPECNERHILTSKPHSICYANVYQPKENLETFKAHSLNRSTGMITKRKAKKLM